jgi:hypothetical protein
MVIHETSAKGQESICDVKRSTHQRRAQQILVEVETEVSGLSDAAVETSILAGNLLK